MKIPPLSDDVINLNMDVLRPPSKGGDRYWDQAKGNKFHAVRTEVDGKKFDSRLEARHYATLRLLEQAGTIRDLQCQVPFELQPAFTDNQGTHMRSITFVADFTYRVGDTLIIEDTKSPATRLNAYYRLKMRMLLYMHRDNPKVRFREVLK